MSFVVLEGVDGVGKTTLAKAVGERLSDIGLSYYSRKVSPSENSFVRECMTGLQNLIWGCGDAQMSHTLLPQSYWLNLQAAWYSAYSENMPDTSVQHVITDGWIYKFAARLVVGGFEEQDLACIFGGSRVPDCVILLTGSIDAIWDRKKEFSFAELGMHDGYNNLGKATFREYQGKVQEVLESFSDRLGWKHVQIDVHASKRENALRVADAVELLLAEQSTASGSSPQGRALIPKHNN